MKVFIAFCFSPFSLFHYPAIVHILPIKNTQGKRIIKIFWWKRLTNCPSVYRGTSEAEGVPNEVRRKAAIWHTTRFAYNAPALRAPPPINRGGVSKAQIINNWYQESHRIL